MAVRRPLARCIGAALLGVVLVALPGRAEDTRAEDTRAEDTAALVATPLAPETSAPFPEAAAVLTLSAAYGNIVEKFIDPVPVGEVALEGMRGLSALDPAVSVDLDGSHLILRYGEQPVAGFTRPQTGDAREWAGVTYRFTQAARSVSRQLHDADAERLYEAMLDGAVSRLDVFSRYAGSEEAARNRAKRSGYAGIGVRYRISDGVPVVTDVVSEGPGALAGIMAGDRIVAVDGMPTQGLSLDAVRKTLRGTKGSEVRLSIARDDVPDAVVMVLERDHIVGPTVSAEVSGGIAHLRVWGFNSRTSASIARKIKALRATHGTELKGAILDLRNNPGGLLRQAVRVADLFLKSGRIISTIGRHPDSRQSYEAGGVDLLDRMPLVVLVNGRSASAAEIVASALQDRGRAVIIGTASYGKGTVQTVVRLPNNGEIIITWSRLMAPSGYALHGLGVLPVVCTSAPKDTEQALIEASLAHEKELSAVQARWRRVAVDDTSARSALRAACPTDGSKKDLDMEVARHVAGDADLYARLLGTATLAEAVVE